MFVSKTKLEQYIEYVYNPNYVPAKNSKDMFIGDRIDKLKAKSKGNVVTAELLNGNMYNEDLTEADIKENVTLIEKLNKERKLEDYLEGMKEGRKEVIQITGLSKIRYEIHKNFGYPNSRLRDFGFRRMGFAQYDNLKVIEKNLTELYKFKEPQIISFQVGIEPFVGASFDIGKIDASDTFIFMFQIILSDMSESTKLKIDLISKINELILSKFVFNQFNFIGYTHQNHEALYEPEILKNGKKFDHYMKYTKIFKNLNKYSKHIKDLDNIKNKCKENNNVIIDKDFLGERDPTKDLEYKSVLFIAFKQDDKYRYVLTSTDANVLKKESLFEIWNQFNKKPNKKVLCSYNNDNYFTGIDFEEMYLISFFVNESELSGLQHFKKQSKKPVVPEKNPNNKPVKPNGKINANDLFKKRLLI